MPACNKPRLGTRISVAGGLFFLAWVVYRPFVSSPNVNPPAWLTELSVGAFLKEPDTHIGSVGALLEMVWATLFRVESYTLDDWG